MIIGVDVLRQARIEAALTQSECARLAGVSYQTIQMLESGKGNPTQDVLMRVSHALGYELSLRPRAFDWAELVPFGLPLLTYETSESLSWEDFSSKVQGAILALSVAEGGVNRERVALGALLLALRDHYPSRFERCFKGSFVKNWLKKQRFSGEVIKLRRVALERLARLL